MKFGKPIVKLIVMIGLTQLSACSQHPSLSQSNEHAELTSEALRSEQLTPYLDSVVLAINFGGNHYTGVDGIQYQPEPLQTKTFVGRSQNIQGSQDSELFESYRFGVTRLGFPLENGRYDITLKFAEPEEIAVGQRIFDVVAESKTVIKSLDIKLARDGKHLSSLVRTVTNVEVKDGELNIDLTAVSGEPVIHALIVRKKQPDLRNWKMIWSDEFNHQGVPDPGKWNFDEWPAKKVNDEDQVYTSRNKNARVVDGKLIIQAHKERYQGGEYTSARLHSLGKGDFLYGKVDIRAKLPAGQGTWSALWMLPSDPYKYATTCQENEDWQGSTTCDAWPNSGEIDIMEHVGYDMHNVHGTVHNKAYYWLNWEQRKASVDAVDVDQTFHVYSMEWSPEYIIISFDGSPYFFYKNEHSGWKAWPFDHPYHLVLNLAIGGAWGRAGGPIDDSIFPVQMEIDYVRVSQLVTP